MKWGGVSLGDTINLQGCYNFLCMSTGINIIRKHCAALPMPYSVIQSVDTTATKEKQDNSLIFCDRHGCPIKYCPDGVLYPNNPDNVNNLPGTTGVYITNNPFNDGEKYYTSYKYKTEEKQVL